MVTQKFPIFFLLLFLTFNSCNKKNERQLYKNLDLSFGKYEIGFESIQLYDSSRVFKVDTSGIMMRPVKIDIWYPSNGKGEKMTYENYFDLYRMRIDFNSPLDSIKVESLELASVIGRYFNSTSSSEILNMKSPAKSEAERIEGNFPLILYYPEPNGMGLFNAIMLEYLASNGFITASISSVGEYPGDMLKDLDGLVAQVEDGFFALKYLTLNYKGIDAEKIAGIGSSWGGLALAVSAILNQNLDIMISLDGSDKWHFGNSLIDDKNFEQIRNSYFFTPEKIEIPYLYMDSNMELYGFQADSVYRTFTHIQSDENYYLKYEKLNHDGFNCFPTLTNLIQKQNDDFNKYYIILCETALNFINENFKDEEGLEFRKYEELILKEYSKTISNTY